MDETLVHLTEEQLLIRLGEQLAARDRGILPKARKELIADARAWMARHFMEFEREVCRSKRVRELAVEVETPVLASAIADLILGVCVGVSPVTVAYLLVKHGVSRLCKQQWESQP